MNYSGTPPQDLLGRDIEPGCWIVYPASWGSQTLSVLARVRDVVLKGSPHGHPDRWTLRVNRYRESARRPLSDEDTRRVITLQYPDRVTVIAAPGDPAPVAGLV